MLHSINDNRSEFLDVARHINSNTCKVSVGSELQFSSYTGTLYYFNYIYIYIYSNILSWNIIEKNNLAMWDSNLRRWSQSTGAMLLTIMHPQKRMHQAQS